MIGQGNNSGFTLTAFNWKLSHTERKKTVYADWKEERELRCFISRHRRRNEGLSF